MKPVRTVEVQVIELDAVEDAARRERVQGAFLGFNVGVTVMLFGVGLVRGELLVLLPALALGVEAQWADFIAAARRAESYPASART